MKKLNGVLFLLIAVLAGMFLAQHRVVQRLEAENKRLRDENARGSAGQDVTPQNAAIGEEREREKSELLRLRGEVNGLRRALSKVTNSASARSVANAPTV